MKEKLVLIEVNKVLVTDQRDVSEYVSEAIRSRYGMQPEVRLEDYEGMTSKEMIIDILKKVGLDDEEIAKRLDGCAEELGYSYYNVAGREAISIMDGSKQLLDEMSKRGFLIGIATGEVEELVKNRLERAGMLDYFKFGSYGNTGTSVKEILKMAFERAVREYGISDPRTVYVIASYPGILSAAKELGFNGIGVATGKYKKEELEKAGAEIVVSSLKEKGKIMKKLSE